MARRPVARVNAAADPTETPASWRPFEFSTFDGLRLHARDYGTGVAGRLPVVCLPGLTRNSKDFHDLAADLGTERRVVALDFRGRGLSEHARTADDYTPLTEMHDTLALLDAAGIGRAVFVGTSRGGIVTMLAAVARPTAIAAAVLNDIGPHIEPGGLLRIAGYVSHSPSPENWAHAVTIVRQINEPSFTDLSDEEWEHFARCLFRDVDGRPRSDFDPRLIKTLEPVSAAQGHVPDLWPQFEALRHVPVLVVRGENSDLLGAETVERMGERHPNLQALTVRNRGHAPFLTEPGVARAIRRLIERSEGATTAG